MAIPIVSNLDDNYSVEAGGESIIITGLNFTGATAVTFGDTEAASFVVDSDIQITAITPAHATAEVILTVTNPDGTSVDDIDFYFGGCPPLEITLISPKCGRPGTTVTICCNPALETFNGAVCGPATVTSVFFGGTAAISFTQGSTCITAVVPAGTGTKTISVATTISGSTPAATGSADFCYNSYGIGGNWSRSHVKHNTRTNNTNKSISHSVRLNDVTVSAAIGLRRKTFLAAAAAAGDPHFVGFDGEHFDYHGEIGGKYLIYYDGELNIIATFTEPDLNIGPHLAGMTFMTVLEINGFEITPKDIPPAETEEIITETGMVRGIPDKMSFIGGATIGMNILEFSKGQLIVTSMDSAGLHINIAFNLITLDYEATGILGQTLLPKDKRKPNDEFKV